MALGGWKARERARTEDVVCSHATHSALRRLRSRPNGPLGRPGLLSDVPTFKERRQAYNGRVEVWVNTTKRFDALARLIGYVDVSMVPTLGAEDLKPMDGVTSWDGYLDGLDPLDVVGLLPEPVELRFPDGRVGEAFLRNPDGRLQGSGVTPFD